jgi:protein transport protein SEC24
MDRPPMAPAYVFVIDVSLNSIQSGVFSCVIETIKDILTNDLFANVDRTKIAFITYDSNVNFYKINPNNGAIQQLCIGGDQMFLPAPVI